MDEEQAGEQASNKWTEGSVCACMGGGGPRQQSQLLLSARRWGQCKTMLRYMQASHRLSPEMHQF